MYFSGWISLVIVSLWVSLLAFLWAVRSGQFSDQARARYLPLEDQLDVQPLVNKGKPGAGAYALLIIALVGIMILLTPLAISLYRLRGTG